MPFVSITRLRVRPRPAAVAGRWSILAWACSLHSPSRRPERRPGQAQRTSATSLWPRRMRQSAMQGLAATAHHWLSTKAIEDTLAATQFRSVARAAKIGHAREIRIAMRVWKPELYAAWRACKEGRGARAACPDIELQYAHARRRCLTSWPSGGPRRCRRGLASALP